MVFEPERQHRLAVLKVLLLITMVGSGAFAYANLQRGQGALAALELVMGVLAVGLYRVIGRTPYLRRWTLAFLLPLYGVMMLAMALPGTSASVFVWIFVVPLLSYLLLGRRWGFGLSLTVLPPALAVYVTTHYAFTELVSPAPLLNVVFCAIAIWAFSHVYEISRERSQRHLLEMANTDPLTGLPNRARFREVFARERRRSERDGGRLSLLALDVDHFKRINDAYGHEVGDAVLVRLADLFRQRLRATDWICRLGGEEFCVIVPGAGIEQATAIAEDLRARVEAMPLGSGDGGIRTTISVGVAELNRDAESLDALYSVADKRLYEAKVAGRNRVVAGAERAVPA